MSVMSRNPRLDRYYSPLGTPRNLKAMRDYQERARKEAIEELTKRLAWAREDKDDEAIQELTFTLTTLGVDPKTL